MGKMDGTSFAMHMQAESNMIESQQHEKRMKVFWIHSFNIYTNQIQELNSIRKKGDTHEPIITNDPKMITK